MRRSEWIAYDSYDARRADAKGQPYAGIRLPYDELDGCGRCSTAPTSSSTTPSARRRCQAILGEDVDDAGHVAAAPWPHAEAAVEGQAR